MPPREVECLGGPYDGDLVMITNASGYTMLPPKFPYSGGTQRQRYRIRDGFATTMLEFEGPEDV